MVVIPLLLLCVAAGLYVRARTIWLIEQHSQAQAGEIAVVVAARLESVGERVDQTSRYLPNLIGRPEELRKYLQSLVASTDSLEAILVLDKQGTVQEIAVRGATAGATAVRTTNDWAGLDLSRHAVFDVSPASTRPTWLPLSRSPLNGRPCVTISRQTGDAIVAGIVNPLVLTGGMERPGTLADSSASLVDKGGNTLLSVGGRPDVPAVDLRGSPLLAEVLGNGNHTATTIVDGERCITSLACVGATGWRVAVTTPQSVAYLEVSALEMAWLIFVSAAVGGSVAMVWLLAGRVVHPLVSLGRSAAAMAGGQYDVPLPIQRNREMEELAHSLRELGSIVGRRDASLRALQKSLAFAANGVSDSQGLAFFNDLVDLVAGVTGAGSVLVSRWVALPKPAAYVIAARTRVSLEREYSFERAGNPCVALQTRQIVHIPRGVSKEFPESPLLRLLGANGYIGVALKTADGQIAGHITIADEQELLMDDRLRDLLLVLAARAGAELDRLIAGEAIHANQLLYDAISQDQVELVCRSTIDGTITFANDVYCRYFRQTREQLVGRSMMSRVDPDDCDRVRKHYMALSAEHPCQKIEYRVVDPDGNFRWFSWTDRVMLDDKGRIMEYQRTGRDVTDLRELQSELDEMRQQFLCVAEGVESAFWIVDWTTDRVDYLNPAFARIWGIPAATLKDTPMAWTASIHDDDRARVVRNFLVNAANGQFNEEYRIVRPDGSIRWISDRAFPLRAADGQVYRVAGIARDITDQKRGEQAPPPPGKSDPADQPHP